MVDRAPRISIGLPVFNGEQFLEQAINSILAQTLTDFELIISDNASTDRTSDICRDCQARDSRIRYHRNETNIGGGNNYNLTFRMSRGRYFSFAAHDDIYAPQFLEKCVEILDKDSSVVLSQSIITEIDERGNALQVVSSEKGAFRKPHERFRALAGMDHHCQDICGLIRSDILRKTHLLLNYTDSDRTLLAEISLYGRFQRVPEPLFYKRIHPKMSTMAFPDYRGRMAWYIPGIKERIVFPNWLQFFHYVRVIAKAPISAAEQFKCYAYMLRWLVLETHGLRMAGDIKRAIKKTVGIRPRQIG
jgi:glycosyltransferase involved in cell wall biosynthesis